MLKNTTIDYVVLRWFDEIENIKDLNEDIDILISDSSIPIFSELIDGNVGVLPLDVYSSSGEDTTSYAGLPYYPREIAYSILENKVLHNNDFYVPDNKHHLLSLTYHVVFHKSLRSGLNISNKGKLNKYSSKRNYESVLNQLFEINKLSIKEVDLKSLYVFLKKNNFLPEYDLLLKLKNLRNDTFYGFLVNDFRNDYLIEYNYIEGLSVFLLRDLANTNNNIKKIIKYFDEYGFDLIFHSLIPEKFLENAQKNIRGGKWDKGDFKINAGKPVYYFIIFDELSIRPKGKYKTLYPNLENVKATKLKIALRNSINKESDKSLNALHSSDDFFESVFYLKQLGFSEKHIKYLNLELFNKKKQIETNYVVVKDLSRHGSRAKVELIKYKNSLAVKKTFKKTKLDFLNREIWFLKIMAQYNFTPKLLDYSVNYLITEFIDNDRNQDKIEFSIKNIIQFRSFFEILYKKNITILDVNESNIIIDKFGNLKIIDFEFAQKYKKKPKSICEIYELGKIPIKEVEVFPFGHELYKNAYNLFWKNKILLTKRQFFKIKQPNLIKVLRPINKLLFNINDLNFKIFKKLKKKCKTYF
ncbi:hypothetical protein [Lacinutrix salivirga]